MKEFIKLLDNTENRPQLFRYLLDAQIEMQAYKIKTGNLAPAIPCGEFFDRAFGLNLSFGGHKRLGEFIREGKFKPRSMTNQKLVGMEYAQYSGSIEMYWGNLEV